MSAPVRQRPVQVAILISGGGSNMLALAESLRGTHPGRCCLVLANRAEAGGLAKARARGLPTAVVAHAGRLRGAFEVELDATLRAAGAEVLALAGFMRVLGPGFVAGWRGRVLNIHPSLLPKYPGLNTHARALAAGEADAGCSVHLVTEALDAGPLLGQARVPVLPGDTPETLAQRVLAAEHRLYPAVLRRFVEGFVRAGDSASAPLAPPE